MNRIVLALVCLSACALGACMGGPSRPQMARAAYADPSPGSRSVRVPAQLAIGGVAVQPSSTLILGLN